MSGHGEQSPRSGYGEQNPHPGRGGQYPGLWRPNHGVPVPDASHSRTSRSPPPNAAGPTFRPASYSYQYAPAPAPNHQDLQFRPSGGPNNAEFAWCASPAQPPWMYCQPPYLQFRHPGPYQEPRGPRQLSPPPPPPGTSPKPSPHQPPAMPQVPSSPSPPLLLHPLGKRQLEQEEQLPLPKWPKLVTLNVTYIPVLEFLDKNPATVTFEFNVGSVLGDIPPRDDYEKVTESGSTALDGFVEHLSKLHAANKSYGGDFDVSDMLVSAAGPLHVTIDKVASLPASKGNIRKDLMKLVNCLVRPRYGEDGKRPAYVDDFISRVQKLRPDTKTEQWEIKLWVIRHHPLLVEPAKRRLLLEDFYKFYKTLSHDAANKFIRMINRFCHRRWHVLIAPRDEFLTNMYWKDKKQVPPPDYRTRIHAPFEDDNEDKPEFYPFTSEDGYLAVFLRTLLVHGPEEASAYEIELEELELIIAHYFGKFLPTFVEQLKCNSAEMYKTVINELLNVYAGRRSVSWSFRGKDGAWFPSVW